jgi:hypothetical protein
MILLAAVGASTAAAQQSINERRAAPRTGSVRVFNLIGSTKVIGWAKDTVWVSGTIPPGGGHYFGASGPNTKIGIDASDDPATPPSDLVIYVPSASRVFVKAATASVDVQQVTGGVDVSSVSGVVNVSGNMEQLNIESMDGDITLNGSAPWTRVHTASGAVTLNGSSEDLGITSVSGVVVIAGGAGRFRRCHVESVTGDVRFAGDLAADAKCEFETHSGAVVLDLPAILAAGFDISTLQGKIMNSFGSGAAAVTQSVRGAEAAFTVGAAGAEVKVRSFKGNVYLKKRKMM